VFPSRGACTFDRASNRSAGGPLGLGFPRRMTVSPDNTLFTKALCCWAMINFVRCWCERKRKGNQRKSNWAKVNRFGRSLKNKSTNRFAARQNQALMNEPSWLAVDVLSVLLAWIHPLYCLEGKLRLGKKFENIPGSMIHHSYVLCWSCQPLDSLYTAIGPLNHMTLTEWKLFVSRKGRGRF
jgi:hypothetical protein